VPAKYSEKSSGALNRQDKSVCAELDLHMSIRRSLTAYVEPAAVCLELLHSARPEGVAGRDHDVKVVLQQPIRNLHPMSKQHNEHERFLFGMVQTVRTKSEHFNASSCSLGSDSPSTGW
jgi:hypothetical protein